MTRTVHVAALLTTCLLLASCASMYTPPNDGKLARIKFVGNQNYAYVDEGDSCSTRKLVDRDLWSSTYIHAGKRIWIDQGIDTRGTMLGYYCGTALSFIPEEDTTYIAEYTNEAMRCRISLYRLASTGAREREVTVRYEKPKACIL